MRDVIYGLLAIVAGLCGFAGTLSAQQAPVPQFRPEPFWPNPLPENWILGQVSGIAVDRSDNIWLIHRPRSLLDDEKGAADQSAVDDLLPRRPAVLKFDSAGKLLASWGGPGGAGVTTGRSKSTAFISTMTAMSGPPATAVRTATS